MKQFFDALVIVGPILIVGLLGVHAHKRRLRAHNRRALLTNLVEISRDDETRRNEYRRRRREEWTGQGGAA